MKQDHRRTADKVLEHYEKLENQGEFDDPMNEAIPISKLKARLARIPSTFDRPITFRDLIALIEVLVERNDSKGRTSRKGTGMW